jgi:hypothetical protein
MQARAADDASPAKEHLQQALTTSEDPEVRFHLRQALQFMTE